MEPRRKPPPGMNAECSQDERGIPAWRPCCFLSQAGHLHQHPIPRARWPAVPESFEECLTLVLGGGLPLGSNSTALIIVDCKKSLVLEQQNKNVREKV